MGAVSGHLVENARGQVAEVEGQQVGIVGHLVGIGVHLVEVDSQVAEVGGHLVGVARGQLAERGEKDLKRDNHLEVDVGHQTGTIEVMIEVGHQDDVLVVQKEGRHLIEKDGKEMVVGTVGQEAMTDGAASHLNGVGVIGTEDQAVGNVGLGIDILHGNTDDLSVGKEGGDRLVLGGRTRIGEVGGSHCHPGKCSPTVWTFSHRKKFMTARK